MLNLNLSLLTIHTVSRKIVANVLSFEIISKVTRRDGTNAVKYSLRFSVDQYNHLAFVTNIISWGVITSSKVTCSVCKRLTVRDRK